MHLTPEQWHERFIQQARWSADLRRHLYTRAGLSPALRALEVGCGTAAVLQELPGRGLITHGLDIDHAHLLLARQHAPGASLVQGDAHRLPYADASFDLLLCHFLLLWVSDPQAVVDEMARLARPGGRVMALAEPDYGGRIDYPEELAELGRLQERALQRQGAETRLGRRLGALLRRASLSNVESGVLGGQWRAAPARQEWESEWAVLAADLQGVLPADELARLRELDARAWQEGERTLFVPTFYAWGRKPGGIPWLPAVS